MPASVSGVLRAGTALAGAAVLAAGCSGVISREPPPSTSTPYQRDRSETALEVPPDLSQAGIREAYTIPGAAARRGREKDPGAVEILPSAPDMRIERDGRLRRLVVAADPSDLWDRVREFWRSQGFALAVDEPATGTMETGWAEKRAALPVGGVRRIFERFKRFAYQYGVRDRFRTRFERGPEGARATEIYVTHRGAHEVVRGADYAWTPRPSDPNLEAEMLNRLMLYLGRNETAAAPSTAAADGAAAPAPRAVLVEAPDGGTHVLLEEGFSRAWRLTALALDRAGFTVEDRDRSQGLFFVRYIDPDLATEKKRSLFGRLAFWSRGAKRRSGVPEDVEFRITVVAEEAGRSRVEVRNAQGRPAASASADRILALLAEQLE